MASAYLKKMPAFFLAFLFIAALTSPPTAVSEELTLNIPKARDKGMVLSHFINITLNIKNRSVSGVDRIAVKAGTGELMLFIRSGSVVDRVEHGGKPLNYNVKERSGENIKAVFVNLPEPDGNVLAVDIYFHGVFEGMEKARKNIKRGVAFVEDGVIAEDGAFLPSSSMWYPQEENEVAMFEVSISSPPGFTSIAEGEWLGSVKEGDHVIDTWKTEKPLQGLDIVTGKYFIEKENYKGIDIYTFFFNKDDSLSKTYIEKTKGYLDLYQDMIGPYPFRKFAVVEEFLPTGYGMPSFTLLGSAVIRLPFIPDTSLGHEIAHNWWGNSVFVDNSIGNWSEAITTYTADYLFAKRSGEKEAREFRINKLRGYKNFAGDRAIALKDFVDSTTPASRAVGYNKGVMVFNMLNGLLGSDAFNKGLREFYRGSAFRPSTWEDIRKAFEKASGKNLEWFFDEWVFRPGAPGLSLGEVTLKRHGKGFLVTLDIKQGNPGYIMDLPVVFNTEAGKVRKAVRIEKPAGKVSVELDSKPISLEIDPEYEVFRLLSDEETPPTLASFFGDKNGVIVIPGKAGIREKYIAPAEFLSADYNISYLPDSGIHSKDYLKDRSMLVFGGPGENGLFPELAEYLSSYARLKHDSIEIDGRSYGLKGTILVLSMKNPVTPAKTICLLFGDADKERILKAAKRMRYFTQYSYLVITDEKLEKGTVPGKAVLRYEFSGSEKP